MINLSGDFMKIKTQLEPSGNPLTGILTFYQNNLPPLGSGKYTLSVGQKVSSTSDKIKVTKYENLNRFAVLGPRFSLDPVDVLSIYPPADANGTYENVIPHICFGRGTLPWERSAGSPSAQQTMPDTAPWLALLSIAESEQAHLEIKQVKLIDLLSSEYKTPEGVKGALPDHVLFPKFPGPEHNTLEYGQSWEDPCLILDISLDLFNAIAPAYADIPWLAHVREIKPTNKQSALYLQKLKKVSTETTPPRVSTVISNRLPEPGANTLACLVSLENWAAFLPGESGEQSPSIPEKVEKVRLVLLYRWQFYAVKQDQTFTGYLLNLNNEEGENPTLLLQLPVNKGVSDEDQAINHAFNMGYVPVNHHTRQGDQTVSWYRGPLLPFRLDGKIKIPVPGPDSVTAYNPDTGMFDVSYAAAWTLGRLLALQNNHFAENLYNWKRENILEAISNFEAETIKRTLLEIVKEEPALKLDTMENLELINLSIKQILAEFIRKTQIHEL